MDKIIKSARFLAEDENGFVIGEADTYEEAQAFGGTVIDTQGGQAEGGLFQSRKPIKSVSVNKQWTGNFTDFNDALDYAKTLLEEQYSDCEVSLGSDEGGDFFTISNDKINHKFYVDEDGATMVDDNGNVVANSSMLEDWEDLAASVMDLMDIYAIDYDDVYNDDEIESSRKPVKSSFYVRCCDQNDNDVGFVTVDKKISEDESKIKYFDSGEQAEDFANQMYDIYEEDNLGYEFYVDEEITSSRKPVKSSTTNSQEVEYIDKDTALKEYRQYQYIMRNMDLEPQSFTDWLKKQNRKLKGKENALQSSRKPVKSSYGADSMLSLKGFFMKSMLSNDEKKAFEEFIKDSDFANTTWSFEGWETIYHNWKNGDYVQSSRKISSSQKGFHNVAEGTKYDDYHVDTTGMGILDVEYAIEAIEDRGNQAVLTVQTNDGAVQHTYFTLNDWKKYKDAKNSNGVAVTDVWITEVNPTYTKLTNARKPITSSSNENAYVYMIGGGENWTKEDALACLKNHVTNYGYYRLGDNEGYCLVGRYEDIINLVEDYFGLEVVDDYMCHWNDFDWDDAEKLDKAVKSSNSSRELETEVIRKLTSGKISEEGAVRIIATAKKCNTGYARQILSHWLEDRAPSLLKSGLADVRGDMNKEFELDGDIDSWSAEYVPQSGKATTKGGEILRAFNVIQCAWFNHGQRLGKGKDKELLNSAAKFLKNHSDEKTVKVIDNAFRCKDIESYDNAVESMKLTLSNFLCNNSDLFESANDEDMLDYYEEEQPEETVDKIELTDEENGTTWKFAHNGENSWMCEDVETDSELAEGDTFTEGSGFEDEVDKTAEFGTFTKDGVEYEYEATGEPDENNEYHDWEITKAVPEENICDEGQEISGDEIIGYMNDGYECRIEVDEEPTEEQLRS